MSQERIHNQNGGLTIVSFPGFEKTAEEVQRFIQEKEKEKHADKAPVVDLVTPIFKERISGEPYCQLSKEHIGGHDCVIVTGGPGNWKMLGKLQMLLSYLVGRRAKRITIIFGYFPLGRSDKDEGELELALPTMFVRQWQAAANGNLDRIIALDLHSPQIVMSGWSGLITEVSMARKILHQAVTDAKNAGYEKIIIHFPDDGAAKRYEKAYDRVTTECGIKLFWTEGSKRRSNDGNCDLGPITGDIEKLNDSLVIIMDDEAATMTTTLKWADSLLKNYSCKEVWGSIVHGVFCGDGHTKLTDPDCPMTRLYCSDSIPFEKRMHLTHLLENKKIHIVSWITELANIIYHHHKDESLRQMR